MGFGSEKKQRSNQQRLKALQQKREETTKRVSTPAAHHTVFTDSSDSEQGGDKSKDALAKKDVLPLFNLSDNEDAIDESTFAEKKQFSGRTGEKLFRLQRRIGLDKRFRLDEKFAEESSSESSDEDDNEMEVDDVSKQLEREKTNALHIIDSILGRDTSSAHHNKVTNTLVKPVDLFPMRYDPEAANHSELEQSTPKAVHSQDSPLDDESGESGSEQEDNKPSSAQESSNEKYFTVNSDLKELFTTTSTSEGFRFFDDTMDAPSNSEVPAVHFRMTTEDSTATVTLKHRKKHKAADEEHQGKQTIENDEETTSRPRVLFFFHSDSPTLRNRLDENTFYRTKSLKELELNWAAKRTAMKQCFRKRHKEAIKYSKKKIKDFKKE